MELTALPPVGQRQYLGGAKLLMTMISITLVGFLMLLDTSIVSTAVPRITDRFHSLNDVGWYGTAYLLTNCALQPMTGKIYTQSPLKWTFIAFFSVFELGSLLCGVASSSNMLIIGRAVAGMGASGLLNGAFTIVHQCMEPERQAGLLGILMGVSQLGLLSGPLIGGALTEYASWRWCFYINLPCGLVVALCLFFISLPENSSSDTKPKQQSLSDYLKQLDLLGFSIFAVSSTQVLLALNWGGTKSAWNSATVIGLFCGSGGALIAFVVWEGWIGREAMIPFALVKRQVVWSSCINYGCFAGCLLTSSYYLPIYFQAVRGASPTMSGVDLLPSILGNMIFAILTGSLVGRLGYYLPFGVASGVLTVIGSALLTTLSPNSPTRNWIGYQILQGAGRGFGLQIPVIAVQHAFPSPSDVSIVTALVVFSQQFGGAVFLSLAEVVFSVSLRENLAKSAPEVNALDVIKAGATGVRHVVDKAKLAGVFLAYSGSIDRVMRLTTGAAGGALLFALGMGWVSIKKKTGVEGVVEGDKSQVGEVHGDGWMEMGDNAYLVERNSRARRERPLSANRLSVISV